MPSETPTKPSSIEAAESEIRFQNYETVHAWSQDGTYRFGRNGSENRVTFTDEELAMVKDSIFLHNHPTGTTLSRQDVYFLSEYDPAEVRICTAKARFILYRPVGGWSEDTWAAYNRAFRIEAGRHKKDYESGKITEKTLDSRTYKDTMKRFVRELGIDYREETF